LCLSQRPPPRKSHWRPATLHGHSKRQTRILRNELYVGRLIWNRVGMVRNPETGKRLSRPRPESEWQRTAVPHLRIVDDKTFDLVQTIRPSARTRQFNCAAGPSAFCPASCAAESAAEACRKRTQPPADHASFVPG
jgi:site-specific DNA recombinase